MTRDIFAADDDLTPAGLTTTQLLQSLAARIAWLEAEVARLARPCTCDGDSCPAPSHAGDRATLAHLAEHGTFGEDRLGQFNELLTASKPGTDSVFLAFEPPALSTGEAFRLRREEFLSGMAATFNLPQNGGAK